VLLLTCEQCSTPFTRPESHVKRHVHNFCCVACFTVYKTKKIALSCKQCGNTFLASPSRRKLGKGVFCGRVCQYAYRKENKWRKPTTIWKNQIQEHTTAADIQVPARPHSEWKDIHCDYCGKILHMTAYKARRSKKHYCSSAEYWKAKQGFYSTYNYRGLEATLKQKLVRFLVSHSIGEVGLPGEEILIHVKSGFYVPGLSYHSDPLALLINDLKQIGHHRLAQMVQNGDWQDEKNWLCFSEGWYHRRPQQFPWERD
jgi:hypothetical protein